jgi:hypothetical protein
MWYEQRVQLSQFGFAADEFRNVHRQLRRHADSRRVGPGTGNGCAGIRSFVGPTVGRRAQQQLCGYFQRFRD